MSKNKEYLLLVINIGYIADASLIYLLGNNIGDFNKQNIVSKTEFESIIPSIRYNFFHQRGMNFVNILELSDQKYHTNGNVRDENYKGRFLFPMK